MSVVKNLYTRTHDRTLVSAGFPPARERHWIFWLKKRDHLSG
jgi:hypothetical protein